MLACALALLTSLANPGRAQDDARAEASTGSGALVRELVDRLAPGPVPVDRFHPERDVPFEPARGGSVTVSLASMPPSLNAMVDSSSTLRSVLEELHEPLVRRDQETWEWRGVLAERWRVEDLLVLNDGTRLHGRVKDLDGRVEIIRQHGRFMRGNDLIPDDEVAELRRGCVFTFELRKDVRWHDGHPFDARDVAFSFECFRNPDVRCDSRRARFARIEEAEQLGPHTVRFTFAEPYFLALATFDDDLTILPSHVYDLADPDCPARVVGAVDPRVQAEHVNRHPANRDWIGLGPYRLERLESDAIVARRFDGYFDPARGGFLDEIRWRRFASPQAAERALVEGELDFHDRLSSEDYLSGLAHTPEFLARCYAGLYVTPYFGYVAWNVRRPELADPRVRRALAAAFDWEPWIDAFYGGLAFRVTGEQFPGSPGYDRELEPVPYDPRAAEELLREAGWYDRDGDGVVDRDGRPLAIELAAPAGNPVSAAFGLAFQERLAAIGVSLELVELEWATLAERLAARDFDAVSLGLTLDLESDPEQLWHSRWADGGGANRSGLADPEVDRLIDAIQVELDDARRAELFHALQRRVHALQPFLFGVCVARRFAMARRVRNVQLFALEPGYALRRWCVVDGSD